MKSERYLLENQELLLKLGLLSLALILLVSSFYDLQGFKISLFYLRFEIIWFEYLSILAPFLFTLGIVVRIIIKRKELIPNTKLFLLLFGVFSIMVIVILLNYAFLPSPTNIFKEITTTTTPLTEIASQETETGVGTKTTVVNIEQQPFLNENLILQSVVTFLIILATLFAIIGRHTLKRRRTVQQITTTEETTEIQERELSAREKIIKIYLDITYELERLGLPTDYSLTTREFLDTVKHQLETVKLIYEQFEKITTYYELLRFSSEEKLTIDTLEKWATDVETAALTIYELLDKLKREKMQTNKSEEEDA